jgi:glucan 1,3-beta-glucosidase
VFRAHWDAWVTEDHLKELADRGVEIVRLPIGDWTLTQYGPYIGCMDGAAEKIEWFLDTAHKYNIKVLLDFHALKDSQNGYDNSGKASDVEWIDETHYKHWSTYNWHWVGEWNGQSYDSINWENIKWDVDQVRKVMSKWGKHPALYALEPINEPVY